MNDRRTEKPLTVARITMLWMGNLFLTIFLVSVVLLGIWFISRLIHDGVKDSFASLWAPLIMIFLLELVVFWAGIIMVYITSVQLGVRMRILGLLCGMIPIVHLVVLVMIINITGREARFERAKMKLDEQRSSQQICKTKYPILMVHGVFFRDMKHLNYWGRVPGELEKNGATIYYGNHQSALSVENSAAEILSGLYQFLGFHHMLPQ